jgi:polar amino acid transport system substrate-binding protein
MKRTAVLILCLFLLQGILCMGLTWASPPAASGKKLVVAVVQDPPYSYKNEQGQWIGLNVELWQLIAKDLKYDFAFREMGFEDTLVALRQGKIDLSTAAMFITAEREQQFELTTPFGSTHLAVATLSDKGDHPWLVALKIFFSWGMLKILLFLVLVLLVLGALFWMIERKSNPEHFGEGLIKGIGSGIYWVGSTLASGVCFGISLKSVTGRILGLMWMMICALALSALIASLSSSLTTIQQGERKFTADKLRGMHLGTEAGGMTAHLIEKMGGRSTFFKEEEEVIKAVLDKKIDGFFYDEVTLHYYAEKPFRGKISVHSTNLKEIPIGFGLPKNSPLRKPVNVAMLGVLEGPMWESILNRYGLDKNFVAKPILMGREKKTVRRTD